MFTSKHMFPHSWRADAALTFARAPFRLTFGLCTQKKSINKTEFINNLPRIHTRSFARWWWAIDKLNTLFNFDALSSGSGESWLSMIKKPLHLHKITFFFSTITAIVQRYFVSTCWPYWLITHHLRNFCLWFVSIVFLQCYFSDCCWWTKI